MTDEELIARLRGKNCCESPSCNCDAAADRIEALRARIDTMICADTVQTMLDNAQPIMAEACAGYEAQIEALTAQVERLRGALGHIESMTVHSGGEIHGVTAQHWQSAFEEAQEVARAALSATEEGK